MPKNKSQTSIRLSDQDVKRITSLQKKLGINQTAIISLGISLLYDREGISIDALIKRIEKIAGGSDEKDEGGFFMIGECAETLNEEIVEALKVIKEKKGSKDVSEISDK